MYLGMWLYVATALLNFCKCQGKKATNFRSPSLVIWSGSFIKLRSPERRVLLIGWLLGWLVDCNIQKVIFSFKHTNIIGWLFTLRVKHRLCLNVDSLPSGIISSALLVEPYNLAQTSFQIWKQRCMPSAL